MTLVGKFAGVCLALASTSVYAALFEDEEARRAILELRQRVETNRQNSQSADQAQQKSTEQVLESQRTAGEELSQLKQSLILLQSQIDSLKQALNQVRGEREELAREITLLQRSQKEILSGVDDRLKNADEKLKSIDQRVDKLEPVLVQIDGLEFEADPTEKREYEAALNIFRKGEFAAAASSLAAFLSKYPTSGYRPSALFWLGSAKYVLREYADAANQIKVFVSIAPSHARVAEGMLTLANAQAELKQTKDAKKTLEDLIKLHPNTEAATAAKERFSKFK